MTAGIVVVDSVTALTAHQAGGRVVISGSHGGRIAAIYAANAQVRAVAFNDAGRGLDDAGIGGLALLDTVSIAAIAVAHTSARIGDGGDTLAAGIVTFANAAAAACGVTPGMPCKHAAKLLADAPWSQRALAMAKESRTVLAGGKPPVLGCDSIGLVEAADADAVLVIGSHGALHGGEPRSALPVAARAAFFHDAGKGKEDAGVSRLPVLAARGIPAAAVDHRSARIGDARSMWDSGRVSAVNAVAQTMGVRSGMTVHAAAQMFR